MKLITTLSTALLLGALAPAYSQVVLSEDFEGVTTPALPVDWANVTAGSGGWKTHSATINFVQGWQIPGGSKYAVLDDYNNAADVNNPSRLTLPLLDMTTMTTPYIVFNFYFINARTTGTPSVNETFRVQASLDTGKTWTTVDSITTGATTQWQKKFVDLAAYKGLDGVMLAFTYSDNGSQLIGAAVDNIKVYDLPAKDAQITAVTPDRLLSYGVSGKNISIGGSLFNAGSDPITSIDVNYQEGTGPVVTNTLSGLNIAKFTSADFTATTPFALPATVGDYNIKVWLTLTGDADNTNDSGEVMVTTVGVMPKKKLLAEEGTGTWCGWCPRGHVFMDSIAHSPTHAASFSLVAVHNSDPMVVAAYDSKIGTLIGGYPSMAIDRRAEFDPNELFDIYAEQKDYFGYADINLSDVAATGFNYSLKVSVKPSVDLSGDYRLALALTEDDVTGTGSTWAQTNYYSKNVNNIPLKGAGLDWQQEPAKVPAEKMHYNHVARGIFPNPNGAAGSLPATMTAGTSYDYTFNVPMQPYWHRYNDQMHAVVMLIRNSDGVVLNSNDIVVPLGVENKEAGISAFTVFPNPASDNAVVNFSLANASDVDVVVTDMMGRTVQVVNKSEFTAGKHQMNINLSGVAAGVYNVTLNTDNGTISTRLSVVK